MRVILLQRVLRDILVDKVPRVVTHLDSLEMDISLFCFNWFITLFIENIPIPTVLRIWDVFLFEGVKVRHNANQLCGALSFSNTMNH